MATPGAGAAPRLKPHELEELSTLGDILHLIHHRNLNQHRHSIWWRGFSTFRRELQHLLSEYEPQKPSKAAKASSKRAAARIEAWKADMVPRWYLSFTEVIGSTQFSAIGLVLLAILARVSHVMDITAAFENQADGEMQDVLHDFARKDAAELFSAIKPGGNDEDLGEVIGRKEDEDEAPAEPEPEPKEPPRKKKKTKKSKGNAIDDLFAGL